MRPEGELQALAGHNPARKRSPRGPGGLLCDPNPGFFVIRTVAWSRKILILLSPGFRFREKQELTPMAKAKERVEGVWLVCEESGHRNYMVRRRRGLKLRFKKYNKFLKKHTWHVEKKK